MSKYRKIVCPALIVLVFSNLCPTAVKAQTSLIPAIEREALVALYNSTDGDNWDRNDAWLTDPAPCNWYGVTCHSSHVKEIELSSNNLSGTLSSEIGNLIYLENMDLSYNDISGHLPLL